MKNIVKHLMKKNIKKYINSMQSITLFIYTFLFLSFFSCQELKKTEKIKLILDHTETVLKDNRFAFDSLVFVYEDSIYLYEYIPNRCFEKSFYKYGDNVYENINIYHEISGEIIKQDTILLFSLKDTSYIYTDEKKIIATVLDYAYANCKYELKSDGNGSRITIKQSLIEPTYKEIYYYDNKYYVTKYINTFRDNKCVYISSN